MKSLLTALEEGRLVELPTAEKDKALEYLALLLEAVPDVQGSDIVKDIQLREKSGNTALGKGIACPHARIPGEGEMLCAVGWSPQGIEYGAPDNLKVHLVIMYYIPDSQRNSYLKEISGLAKAVTKSEDAFPMLSQATDLSTVRHQLLDWVALAIDTAVPDAKARMIKLQERQAEAIAGGASKGSMPFVLVPFSVVIADSLKPIVLSRDAEFTKAMELQIAMKDLLGHNETFELGGFQVLVRSSSSYTPARVVYECLAVKISGAN